MATQLRRLTATGYALQDDCYLRSLALTAGSDAASVVVRDGASGGELLTLKAAAGTSVTWRSGDHTGVYFGVGVHLTLTGTGPEVTAEIG